MYSVTLSICYKKLPHIIEDKKSRPKDASGVRYNPNPRLKARSQHPYLKSH